VNNPLPTPAGNHRLELVSLGLLFGALYFIQGIAEPTEGLIAQPVRSLLKRWQFSATEIGTFMAIVAIPWTIKPLFGLLTDFVPLFGRRRKSYLIAATAATTLGLAYLYGSPPPRGSFVSLLALLLLPTAGVAMADVVVDALTVEKGQPRGLTGKLQSIQWASIYAAMILTGYLGGWLSQSGRQDWGFLICALFSLASFLMALGIREPARPPEIGTLRGAVKATWQAARSPAVLAIGAYLFLWNFNPFSTTVLQVYMTDEAARLGLKAPDEFYGTTVSVTAVFSVLAALGYMLYCRQMSFSGLVHLSIWTGIASTLAYWAMQGVVSALVVSALVGLTYMTATLIQLDLAARICPPQAAGTAFALLMALTNLSYSLSAAVGGYLYDLGQAWWGRPTTFNILVALGAAFTACCWLLTPILKRQHARWEEERGAPA
jgi:MFS family permease